MKTFITSILILYTIFFIDQIRHNENKDTLFIRIK